jgi:3-deoxy-D-manno-octulosonic-acid transferase
MYTVYNILLNFAFIISSPYLLLRALLGKEGVWERMGRLPKEKTKFLSTKIEVSKVHKNVIWFHAASVGEVKALSTVIPRLKKISPQHSLIVSIVTKSGKEEAERVLSSGSIEREVEFVFHAPMDLKGFVKRTLTSLNPSALILVETELWPNLIKEAKGRNCWVALINGRMSGESFSKYLLLRSLFSETLSYFDLFCMQSDEDAERIKKLGAESDKIKVLGNLKFDRMATSCSEIDKDMLKEKLSISPGLKVMIGGSTRNGEEEILVRVFKRLKKEGEDFLLMLAPRYLGRVKKIERMILQQKLEFIRKSELNGKTSLQGRRIILLDTMGELASLYAIADVAFVGGSLVPIGGHNLLEPAVCGVPVVFGPHVNHFKTAADLLIQCGGGIKIKDEDELYLEILDLLKDEDRRKRMGKAAFEAIKKQSGVSQRTAELILAQLEHGRAKE